MFRFLFPDTTDKRVDQSVRVTSLFGSPTVIVQQDASRRMSVQSLSTTVGEASTLIQNSARITRAVAGFLGNEPLAQKARMLESALANHIPVKQQ